ncbi:MAG: DEAD/DEAH box helicase [Nitrospirota bacterium]
MASSLATVTLPQVRALAAPVVFRRGVEYQRGGAVVQLTPTASGTLWARVQGTEALPYTVSVSPVGPAGLLWECTCPFFEGSGEICKHVVSVLLEWIARRERRTAGHLISVSPRTAGWAPTWSPWSFPAQPDVFSAPSLLDPVSWVDLRLDLIEYPDGPPQVELRFQPPGTDEDAVLTLPVSLTPEALTTLRGRAKFSPQALDTKLLRTSLLPELRATYDAEGRLVLTPSFRHPSRTGRMPGPRMVRVSPTWIWSDGVFFRNEVVPDAFDAYFEPGAPSVLEGDTIRRFLEEEAPRLAQYPRYRPAPDVAASRLLPPPELKAVSAQGRDRDWLWLDPTYEVGGHSFTLSELLTAAESKQRLRRGHDWIAPPLELAPAWESVGGRVEQGRVALPRLGYLRRRAEWAGIDVQRDAAVRRFEADLDRIHPPAPAPDPPGYKGSLRPYQRTGYDWLWFLHTNGFHGILADEMGLGKTHMTMALLLAAAQEDPGRPSLVVCPTSVLDHWEDKIGEYAPSLAPQRYHGFTRGALATGTLPPVVLTTYTLLAREIEVFKSLEWNYVVLDEAQKIKNPSTQTAKAAKALSARHRLALTGTPIENRLAELWSIFDFLLPGYLGSVRSFRQEFERPIAKYSDRGKEAVLKRAIHPFKLRRLKADVLKELPPKVDDIHHCRLSPAQTAIYRALVAREGQRLAEDIRLGSQPIPYIHVFALLSRLKQLCDHPSLVINGPKGRAMPSGKFDLFAELMEEALDGGAKVVVFTQYLGMIDLISAWLTKHRVDFVELRGATRDRRAVVRRFQTEPACRVFVGSLLAGGLGIDLTAASVVIHYDRWWNAARENQATDRVHRIGQTRGVQVIKLITRGTLEDKIDRMIREKARLLDSIVEEDAATLKAFTREELIELLTSSPGDAE